jgi:hypothetical protein
VHPAVLAREPERNLRGATIRRMPTVRMYSRPDCHLCDEARGVILAVHERVPFAFEEVDISGDHDLELGYGIRVPVVLVDGAERFEIAVDAGELEALLRG